MRQRLASFDTTVTVIFFLVMFSSACLIPVQSDTWWHLRAGQEMWTRHVVMLTDEFSYVARGAYWPNHEWLSEVIFFAVFRIGGMAGLTLLAAILITTATALSWRLMRGPATKKLLLMALAMTSIAPVWTVRPHVFSLVLTMTVLQLALRDIYWPLPVLFALWANLHGGVAMGFVVLGGVAISQVWIGQRSGLPKLAIVIAGCFAATLVTPLGIHLWTTIPQSIQKSMANGIVEWRPPALFGLQHLAFWIVLLLFAVTTVVRRRTIVTKEHAALTVVSLALLPLALRYNRNVTPFLLVAVPALSRTLFGEQLEPREPARERYGLNIALMAVCAAGCVAVISVAWSRPLARLKWHPISQPIVDGIRACPGRLYNRFDDGGYVIWFAPSVPVFVDNRQDPYALWFLQEHLHREQSGEFEPVFARYNITCAFLPPGSPTAQRVVQNGWRVTARDADWLVLQAPKP